VRTIAIVFVLAGVSAIGCAKDEPFCVRDLPDGGCTVYQLFSCLGDACLGGAAEHMTTDAGSCLRVQEYCQ